MCEICGRIPCPPRCPNARPGRRAAECSRCGAEIAPGEGFLDGPDGPVCGECLPEMGAGEWMAMFGATLSMAKEA